MDPAKFIDEIGFDLEKAKKCSDMYTKSTGIECFIIDSYGENIYRAADRQCCSFCRNIHYIQEGRNNCRNVHLYGSYQAERFGGKYVFFCPMGLVHWVSPILSGSFMKGALLAGPVLMMDPDEFLLDEIIERNIDDKGRIEEIKKNIKDIPVIKPEVVTSLSDLLFVVTSHIAENTTTRYTETADYHAQQSDISQYIHYIKTMGGDEKSISTYPIEKEKELLSYISMGDKPGAQKTLNEILGHIYFSTGGYFEVMKSRVLELIVLLSRAAMEGGADAEEVFGLNYQYINQIYHFKTVEELSFWLSKILLRFTDCVFNLVNVKHVDIIYKSIEYVKRNYMKKITLEDVASKVYLSPSYFSKLFKEETKYSFNVYLNNVRIEMSKKLLLDESTQMIDVAGLVGFEDQSYFSKVFKKVTGLTPKKFRDSRGKIKYAIQKEND